MSAIWGLLKNGFGASTTATPWEMKSSGFPHPRLPHSSAQRRWAAPPAVFSPGNKKPRLVSIHAESTGVTGVFDMRHVLEGSGGDADPCQGQLLGPSVLANRREAAPPACLLHRLPSLNGVMPQNPPPSHRLRRIWRQRSASVSSRCSYSSNRAQAGTRNHLS